MRERFAANLRAFMAARGKPGKELAEAAGPRMRMRASSARNAKKARENRA